MDDELAKFVADARAKGIRVPAALTGGHVENEGEPATTAVRVELPGSDRQKGGQMSIFARDLGRALAGRGIYCKERASVTVNEQGRMEGMDADRLRTFVEEKSVVTVRKRTVDGETFLTPLTMPRDAAAAVLRSDGFRTALPALARVNVVRMPILRADGALELLRPGYDVETKILTLPEPDGLRLRELTVEESRKVLGFYLDEFPWADERSRSVAIIAMLSMWGSAMISPLQKRMNFIYTANASRSGKTLLAEMAIMPVCGEVQVQSKPDSKEELRKLLEAEAMSGSSYVLLDDLEGNLRDGTLNAFMTAVTWSGRLMARQEKFVAPKISQVFITGNNLSVSPDIAGRALICELFVDEADAQARPINHVMDEERLMSPAVRGDILSALWAIVRHWDQAGRPMPNRRLQGYGKWCEIFGGMMKAAGYSDPLEPIRSEGVGNTEETDMYVLVKALVLEMGADRLREWDFPSVVAICAEHDCFPWILNQGREKEGDLELPARAKSALGILFSSKYGGRVFRLADDVKVRFGHRGRNRKRRYQIERI